MSGEGSMYGGEVILGITQEPAIFDPHTVEAAGDEEILFNIFEGLVKCTSTGEFVRHWQLPIQCQKMRRCTFSRFVKV